MFEDAWEEDPALDLSYAEELPRLQLPRIFPLGADCHMIVVALETIVWLGAAMRATLLPQLLDADDDDLLCIVFIMVLVETIRAQLDAGFCSIPWI